MALLLPLIRSISKKMNDDMKIKKHYIFLNGLIMQEDVATIIENYCSHFEAFLESFPILMLNLITFQIYSKEI